MTLSVGWSRAHPAPCQRKRNDHSRQFPQSVDNVRLGNEGVGARRRLAPTGSTLRVRPDGA